jgi:hypothetical protein
VAPSVEDLEAFPPPRDLPDVAGLPDPVRMLDGSVVDDREDWFSRRRPELLRLFQQYEYGVMPAPPADLQWREV